jgi:hypothetical protein
MPFSQPDRFAATGGVPGQLHRQSGLAAASWPGQRDQPFSVHQLDQVFEVRGSTDEAGESKGQTTHARRLWHSQSWVGGPH